MQIKIQIYMQIYMYTDIYNNTLTDTDIYTTADTLHADYLLFILKSNSSQTWSIIKSCFGAIDSRFKNNRT